MSKTHKDLKSHKKGFGKYGFRKPKRKMTPLSLSADKISGQRHDLVFIENDLNQDDFYLDDKIKNKKPFTHWYNAKEVRSIRRQLKAERQDEKSSARNRMKNQLTKELKNLML